VTALSSGSCASRIFFAATVCGHLYFFRLQWKEGHPRQFFSPDSENNWLKTLTSSNACGNISRCLVLPLTLRGTLSLQNNGIP
jgi:hypothetical protein